MHEFLLDDGTAEDSFDLVGALFLDDGTAEDFIVAAAAATMVPVAPASPPESLTRCSLLPPLLVVGLPVHSPSVASPVVSKVNS